MTDNWRTCDNCGDYACPHYINGPCRVWEPIHCPSCGGILSEIREHDGMKYRHCYACHFEFSEKETTSEWQEACPMFEPKEE